MLTGYNTDVSYGGETFHVQTEDKGVRTPVIVSLVYRAGTILAAKRTRYENLIENGTVDVEALSEILNRQHNLLVAAIQAGKSHKLEELSRKHNGRTSTKAKVNAAVAPATGDVVNRGVVQPVLLGQDIETGYLAIRESASLREQSDADSSGLAARSRFSSGTPITLTERLRIELLAPSRFDAGEDVNVRAAIMFGGQVPAADAEVRLQVIGTRIQTQQLIGRTNSHGLVDFDVTLPLFKTGAAALVLTAAEENGQRAEMKFMIRKQ